VVFAAGVINSGDEEIHKFGRMLATIASDRCGRLGGPPDMYWQEYGKGYYDLCLPAEEEDF
jgi:hypothetical protein